MDIKIVQWLRCPLTRQKLFLKTISESKIILVSGRNIDNVEEGFLISEDEIMIYPIIKGIPRLYDGAMFLNQHKLSAEAKLFIRQYKILPPSETFLKDHYNTLKRFQKEWNKHDIHDKTWGLTQNQRLIKYCEYLDLTIDQKYEGKFFLDVGAGTGQLPTTVARHFSGEMFAIELTNAVEKGDLIKREEKMDYFDRCHFIQADLTNIPLEYGLFDFVHASGVLHHTPDTQFSFKRVIPYVRNGGKIGIWLYRVNNTKLPLIPFVSGNKLGIRNLTLRKWTTKLHPDLLYNLIYFYTLVFHLAYKVNEAVRRKKHTQTIKERVTSLFDAFAPKFVNRHKPEEVMKWFAECGFHDIKETDNENVEGFNIMGVRRSNTMNTEVAI